MSKIVMTVALLLCGSAYGQSPHKVTFDLSKTRGAIEDVGNKADARLKDVATAVRELKPILADGFQKTADAVTTAADVRAKAAASSAATAKARTAADQKIAEARANADIKIADAKAKADIAIDAARQETIRMPFKTKLDISRTLYGAGITVPKASPTPGAPAGSSTPPGSPGDTVPAPAISPGKTTTELKEMGSSIWGGFSPDLDPNDVMARRCSGGFDHYSYTGPNGHAAYARCQDAAVLAVEPLVPPPPSATKDGSGISAWETTGLIACFGGLLGGGGAAATGISAGELKMPATVAIPALVAIGFGAASCVATAVSMKEED